MTARESWDNVRARLATSPEFAAGYERARAGYALARAVRAARLERGWEPEELARRAGVNGKLVEQVELGGGDPNVEETARICAALSLPHPTVSPAM